MMDPSETDLFRERDAPVIRSGVYRKIPYQVTPIARQYGNEMKVTHYTGYICVKQIYKELGLNTDNFENTSRQRFDPPPDIPSNITYGPTPDGWIGFGTRRNEIFNYTNSYMPIEEGYHISELGGFHKKAWHITPDKLEKILQKWIDILYESLTEHQ